MLLNAPLARTCALIAVLVQAGPIEAAEITFNRDIRPILSDNCFLCHGPDQNTRKAKLRLDVRESAIEKGAIVPGKPDESELIKRIYTSDAEEVMPPPDSHKKLTSAQMESLREWVAQGAPYQTHWSYLPPVKAAVPDANRAIDHLVRERLKQVGLKPSPEADRRTLARRLHLDLIGLPPKPERVEAFVSDQSPDAYARLVDELLSSPKYGERMALSWLDVVRFADTIGYHSDNPRNIWPYRDYVIRAFNENKPFDRFTVEQLAGDLLPDANQETRVASAFNRLLLTTEEGGAQPKDYEYRMLTDRVRAVGTVWLGQTLGCSACHDHKFDPTSMKDFYSMGAFFADLQEPIIGRREDGMLVPDEKQRIELERLREAATQAQREHDREHADLEPALEKWLDAQREAFERTKLWTVVNPREMRSAEGAKLKQLDEGSILVEGKHPNKDSYTLSFTNIARSIAGVRLEVLPHDSLPAKGPGRAGNGNFVLSEVEATIKGESGERKLKFKSARATIEQADGEGNHYKGWKAEAAIDGDAHGSRWGWAILPEAGKANQLVLELAENQTLAAGEELVIELEQQHGEGNHTLGHFRLAVTDQAELVGSGLAVAPAKSMVELLGVATEQRDASWKTKAWTEFKKAAPEFEKYRRNLAEAQKAKTEYEANVARCIVSVAGDRRTVRMLPRGNFLQEEKGEVVEPALPAFLPGARVSTPEQRLNRLDLAQWLVARENPLTARVVMNRLWKQLFGTGLSRVLDDLGAQGEPPPNQALLDWLACEFMDSGWDFKRMVRLIVLSDTYRQVSTQTPEQRLKDPGNRELASQSRWRLEAEQVRDNALLISGLLVDKIGGPSVRPYQPEGYWENLNFPPRNYDASTSEAQYRRGMYTWWQRSFVHPSMIAFDAPTREECTAERVRSNIPQQALVLLNDPTYVETSRAFATRILKETSGDAAARIDWAIRQALARNATQEEQKVLSELLASHLEKFQNDAAGAEAFLKIGLKQPPAELDKAELAAWTNVARVILNLHETITRS